MFSPYLFCLQLGLLYREASFLVRKVVVTEFKYGSAGNVDLSSDIVLPGVYALHLVSSELYFGRIIFYATRKLKTTV